jgi:hypothetical protein
MKLVRIASNPDVPDTISSKLDEPAVNHDKFSTGSARSPCHASETGARRFSASGACSVLAHASFVLVRASFRTKLKLLHRQSNSWFQTPIVNVATVVHT